MIEAPSPRCGSATWMALRVPIRLVFITSTQAGMSPDPFMPAIPADVTTMSSLPSSATPSSRTDFSRAASLTSTFAVTTRCPVFSMNCAVSSRSSGVAIG